MNFAHSARAEGQHRHALMRPELRIERIFDVVQPVGLLSPRQTVWTRVA
jgi:hypothetical protein